MSKKPALGVFSLVMITVGSVDSIRNLPATALFGSSLIFFFILAAVLFLLPSALISAELSSAAEEEGGVYVWVKHAFGLKAGFFAIWFQWIENVLWYPTILSFVAATLAYLINPNLIHHRAFLISIILGVFWVVTLVNIMGIRSSARLASFCSVTGLLIPMVLIIALGVHWVMSGRPIQVAFTLHNIIPHAVNPHMWVALTGIMLSFCGMEIATVHGADVRQPRRSYPIAMLLSTIILLVTLLLGSLAIAIVIPEHHISLVAGIMQAFTMFLQAFHLQWVLPVLAIMVIIGGIGGVNNWIISPSRGLLYASQDRHLPAVFSRTNERGAPYVLLLLQAIIVSALCGVFLLLPTINASYWLLTVSASQLYMLMYIMMFAAAIRLRYKKLLLKADSGFRIPGGRWVMWLVAGAGIVSSVLTFVIGFIPPPNIQIGSLWRYESLLVASLLLMSIPALITFFIKKGDG